ncbi:hypothetical protein LIX60_05900 [Streptomyces sp. S07_1.15]|uniref:hypothetical protein n=1 Tax=Streptomyces sp. S07_1.15 TaxID=2873925 RepID=UPI001D140C33|nr:hypothetical protein [Streptomyces sp. S07_1.15]MCC3651018.1 hypothetical protein [Streptomyces sp. S07_1.15]
MTTERIGPRTGADTGGDGVTHDGTAHDGTVHDGTADGGGSEPPRGERNGPADGAGAGSGGRQDGGRDGSPGAGGTPGAGGGPPGDGQGPRRHSSWKHPSNRRRWFILFVVILLIGVPAGYIVISAGQSRDSGRDKQARASAQGLTAEWPPRVTRRIYEVPITGYSDDVAFYESNSWNTSKLYVQFTTSENGLNLFLGRIGTGPGELDEGRVTITAEEAAEVGWHLGAGQPSASSRALSTVPTDKEDWSGLVLDHPGPRPRLKVTVDRSNPAHPMVYVVSTVKL